MRGVHGILYSLFDADEWLHRKAIRGQVQICLNANVAGLAALGLATEVAKLSFV
jgi:4-hydroxy-tetrahydrodipicolinate synthase